MKLRPHIPYIILTLFSLKSFGQIPTEVPHPDNNTPVDFSNPADIIIYIVLPVIVIILYFVWRRNARRREDEND